MTMSIILWGGLLGTLAVAAIGWLITRSLSEQIGCAVSQVRSSSTELQAAANQQAAGAKEQATAMTEIATTISELLATSRQIAESAQRVAQNAEQTAGAARVGHGTVDMTHEFDLRHPPAGRPDRRPHAGARKEVAGDRRRSRYRFRACRADQHSRHQRDDRGGRRRRRRQALCRRRRRNPQTGRSRRRFDQGGAHPDRRREKRGEHHGDGDGDGVEGGRCRLAAVRRRRDRFQADRQLVATATDAAREIELSTKQQSTAVEQVNIAIANVTQASMETETSAGQTLQTVSQMAVLVEGPAADHPARIGGLNGGIGHGNGPVPIFSARSARPARPIREGHPRNREARKQRLRGAALAAARSYTQGRRACRQAARDRRARPRHRGCAGAISGRPEGACAE